MPKKITIFKKLNNLLLKHGGDICGDITEPIACLIFEKIRYCRSLPTLIKVYDIKTYESLITIMEIFQGFGRGTTENKLKFIHGVELGEDKWNEYKNKQSISNTFEYKQEKNGWSRGVFDEYNKSRSVTLKHLSAKHGDIEGAKRWKTYCDRQAYTNTKDHLQHKYDEVCAKKGHSLDSYINRFGNTAEAANKHRDFWENKSKSPYSKISQTLFWNIFKHLTDDEKLKTYFAELNKEYGIYDTDRKVYCKYDFVCIPIKLCIEYQGDHYHGNPSIYRPDDVLRGRGQSQIIARDAWEKDAKKKHLMESKRAFTQIDIWESDHLSCESSTEQRIMDIIYEHRIHK